MLHIIVDVLSVDRIVRAEVGNRGSLEGSQFKNPCERARDKNFAISF